MQAKALEIRDKGTFIACLAVDMNPSPGPAQRWLLRRCGYPCDGQPNILVTRLDADGSKASNNPYFWGDRTWANANKYIIDHWAEINDGDVIDVEFILGETSAPKISERFSEG